MSSVSILIITTLLTMFHNHGIYQSSLLPSSRHTNTISISPVSLVIIIINNSSLRYHNIICTTRSSNIILSTGNQNNSQFGIHNTKYWSIIIINTNNTNTFILSALSSMGIFHNTGYFRMVSMVTSRMNLNNIIMAVIIDNTLIIR